MVAPGGVGGLQRFGAEGQLLVLRSSSGGLPALGLELQSQWIPGGPVFWSPGPSAAGPPLRVCTPRPALLPCGHPPALHLPAGVLLAQNDSAVRAHGLLHPGPGAQRVHQGCGVGRLSPRIEQSRCRHICESLHVLVAGWEARWLVASGSARCSSACVCPQSGCRCRVSGVLIRWACV